MRADLIAQVNLSQVFSTLAGIADQALFLDRSAGVLEMKPTFRSKPNALAAPRPIRKASNFENVSFRYPRTERLILSGLNFRLERVSEIALIVKTDKGKRP